MIRHAYLLVAGASLLGLLVSGYAHVPRTDAEIKEAAKGHAAAPSAVSNGLYKLRTRLTAGASGG